MKRIFILFCLLIFGVCATAQEISVMSIPVSNTNAYGIENTSDIIAKSIASVNKNFVVTDRKTNQVLKNFLSGKNKSINLKSLRNNSPSDKFLVVSSYITDKNGRVFDVWDILKISTDFDIDKPYTMEIKAILADSSDGVVLWQNTYQQPLGVFKAKNMTEVIDKKEKITSYAKNIIAQDITQNIELRLHPKQIDYSSRVPKSEGAQEGIGLKYKNSIPITKITRPPDDDFEKRWRNDDSFSY